MKFKRIKDEGSALLIAMIMILVLSFLASAYLITSVSTYNDTLSRRDALQSRYVAEAGLEWGLSQFNQQAFTFSGAPITATNTIGAYTFQITIEDLGSNVYRIVSAGTANGYSKSMECVLRKERPPFLEFAMVTDGNLNLAGNISITGNVHSNQNVQMVGPGTIIGDASAVGTVTQVGGVTGDVIQGADTVMIPNISLDGYKQEAINNGTYYDSTKTWAGPTVVGTNGVLFVDGDLHLSGKVKGSGLIVVKGDLDITGQVELTDPANDFVIILAGGDAFIRGTPRAHQAFIYALGAVKLRGNVEIVGAMMAKNGVVDDGNAIGDSSVKGHVGVVYSAPPQDLLQRFAIYKAVVRRELD